MRRLNRARDATPPPPVSLEITEADLLAARERFRKHAPREFWGLLEVRDAEVITVLPQCGIGSRAASRESSA